LLEVPMDRSVIYRIHARVTSLKGVSGRLRLDVGANAIATLEVHDGEVELHSEHCAVDAIARCDSVQTLEVLRRGALNPAVAVLQRRLVITGDRELALRIILSLRGTPLVEDARPMS